MLNRQEYDLHMEKVRQETIEAFTGYLKENAELISRVKNVKMSGESDAESVNRVKAMTIPRQGRDFHDVGDEMIRDVFSKGMMLQHPRFFSFVASAVSPYSVAGALLSDIFNLNACGASLAPQAAIIEEKLIKWEGQLAGYKDLDKIGGIFTSGGSMSNFSAMIAARDKLLSEDEFPIGVAYISDQTHSSVRKGLKLIGIRKDCIVIVPTDEAFRMRTDLLEQAIEKDINNGRKPFIVIGSLATTNTGTIDPLSEIGDICEKYKIWFHVDGAFGGSILLSDIYSNLAKGIEKSDSFSWDWHKWSLQTYSCGSLVVKNKSDLLNSFVEHPEYLADIQTDEISNGWDLGPEMSRPHRCLKLWFTLQSLGTDMMADVIDYSFYNAKVAEKMLAGLENWEIISHTSCATFTFRYAPKCLKPEQYNQLNSNISTALNEDGFAYMATTTLNEKTVLRMCIINGNTTTEDVTSTIELLDKIAKEKTAEMLK